MAWCKYGKPAATALPVPPQPTTVTRTLFSSRQLGIVCSIRLLVVAVAVVMARHEFSESLLLFHQVSGWKLAFALERFPHCENAAWVVRMLADASRVGKLRRKE